MRAQASFDSISKGMSLDGKAPPAWHCPFWVLLARQHPGLFLPCSLQVTLLPASWAASYGGAVPCLFGLGDAVILPVWDDDVIQRDDAVTLSV